MNGTKGPAEEASAEGLPRLLREAALCAVFLVFLAGYFAPYLGLASAAGDARGGEASSGMLASAYLALLFGAILTLAVRLLPGRGPAAEVEAVADAPSDGGERREERRPQRGR